MDTDSTRDETQIGGGDASASPLDTAPTATRDAPSHVASGLGVVVDPEAPVAPPPVPGDGGAPVMDQHAASEVDKIAGILVQVRADVGAEPVERIAQVLRQRLADARIDVTEDEVARLARQVSTGDA